jgi:hypothetical protein
MDLAGVQRLICSLPAASRLHSLTTRHLTAQLSSFRLAGWSVSDRRQIQRVSDGTLTQTILAPGLTTTPERVEARVHRDRAGVCCVRA